MKTQPTDYPAFSPSPEEMQKRWDAMSGECSGTPDK